MPESEVVRIAPARARNRRGEGGLLRHDILAATLGLLDETGTTTAVTLRSIAKRAGISAPSIYAHFGSPQEILLAVVVDEFVHLRSYLRAAVERSDGESLGRFLGMCDGYLAFAREFPARYVLLFGGVWNAAEAEGAEVAPEAVAALGVDLLEDLTELLRACVRDGVSASADPPTDATAVWLGLHGLAHQRIVSTALSLPPHIEGRIVARLARLADSSDADPAGAHGAR